MASDLVVHLTANASKFNRGLSDATKGAKSFAGSVVGLFNPLNMSFDSLIAKAAAAGLSFYGIASRIDKLAGIADKAAQTGLSGEFLQKLQYAADQSGIPIESLTSALEKMTLVVGGAERGSEESAKAFDLLGIEVAKLDAMSPDDQFLTIAEAIGKLPTVAQRASASVAIFGKSMGEMGSLFSDGKKGVSDLMKEADQLGIGVSEEDLKSIAKADDAIDKMQSTMSDVLSKITVEMAPVFGQMADHLTAILPKIAELAKAISSALADSLKVVGDIIETDVLPGVKDFLTTAADATTKWSAMPEKWKFLGEVISAAVTLAMEHIKAGWKDMLDDLMTQTADKAVKLAKMLNPTTAVSAVGEWLAESRNSEWSGVRTTSAESDLSKAQRTFDNLLRQLNGEAPIPEPSIMPKRPPVKSELDAKTESQLRAAVAASAMSQDEKRDPNVKATERQTKALVDALKQYGQKPLTVVEEF